MKNFYNARESLVSDAIDGLIAASGGRLLRFDPSSHARVIVRADWDNSKVAIISGGGSGHEPAHAGLIGPGLLTAAVCGDVYASPSVDAVLSAILQVTGESGCLLIIKNYTGDRLNFGLAAEKAKSLGHKVEMVIVGDDTAIADAVQPRGLAGTIFLHKVAGHLSEEGETLDTVFGAAQAVAREIKTLGLSRDTCTVPGSQKQDRIGENEVEVGLGIHGEPGVDVKTFANCEALMQDFSERLLPHLDPSKRHIALFNNLGGLNGLECSVLFKEFMASDLAKLADFTIGPVAIMTALDMPGFSISFVPIEEQYRKALLSEIDCPAWPPMLPVSAPRSIDPPKLVGSPSFNASSDPKVKAVIEAMIETCISSEAELNELDAKVGDGDTGTTFAAAARTIQAELEQLPMANGEELFVTLSDITSRLMGGSSGVLFAIFFANAAEAYKLNPNWGVSLSAGLDAMQKYGGANLGDRTMIDSLKPALEAIVSGAGIDQAAQEARAGAIATSKMLSAKAGRSSYLEARSLDGHADPGAEGIARIFEGISKLDL